MTPMTVISAVALTLGAVIVGNAAKSVTTVSPTPAPPARQAGAPTVNIDVFELMGKALGELPVEQADTN